MKSLISLWLFAAILSFVAGSRYRKAAIEIKEAFPGIIVKCPEVLKVVFDNGAYLDLGKNITPTESKNQPVVVDWNADKDTYYTLMVADPDIPSRKDPYMRDLVTWLVGNIPGKDIGAADILFAYISAGPPKNMGMQRYFYFIFQQPEKLKFDEERIHKYTIEGRVNLSVADFVKKYKLVRLDAVNFFTSYFDPHTEALYKELNCCKEFL